MSKIKNISFTKKDISKQITLKTGLPKSYSGKIVDDLILILKELIKEKEINIKNFATFKILSKTDRIGRNPKNKQTFKINARNSLSFKISKKFSKKIKNL